jgi:aminoglycoside phosphotransferase (APT) family kinase protein
MANVHRRFLDPNQLQVVLRRCGVDSPLARHAVLEGGTFNTVYRLEFADRPALVLKLSPDPAGAAMTYEQGIVRTEAEFYRRAGAPAGLPVPEVIGVHDLDADHGGGQALLVSELPGVPWFGSGLPDEARAPLRRDLGALVASLHAVTGPAFGYPSESTGPLTSNWGEAFGAMMDAVLADAERYHAPLPVAPEQVRRALTDCAGDLASVRVPSLVHFDLWDGNVLVDLAGVPRIAGIIDGERAMWGDPVVDLVSTALFGEIRDDEDFIRGYESTGAVLPLDASARRRLLLYRIYLGLIMTVEPIPRGQATETDHEVPDGFDLPGTVAAQLKADLAELEVD